MATPVVYMTEDKQTGFSEIKWAKSSDPGSVHTE